MLDKKIEEFKEARLAENENRYGKEIRVKYGMEEVANFYMAILFIRSPYWTR